MKIVCYIFHEGNLKSFKVDNLPARVSKPKIIGVKIKNGEEMIDATIEMVDGNMIVLPKVEKFEPKDGDVVTYFNGNKPTIYIYRCGHKYNTSFSAAYSSMLEGCFIGTGEHIAMNRSDIRPATEEEKKLLFEKLKEEGYEWDAEKKELVKLKWKPVLGEVYYRPQLYQGYFEISKEVWNDSTNDEIFYNKCWCFKTGSECQAFCNKLNQSIEGVKP